MHPKDSRDFWYFDMFFVCLFLFLFTQSNLKSNQQYFGNGFVYSIYVLRDLMDDENEK